MASDFRSAGCDGGRGSAQQIYLSQKVTQTCAAADDPLAFVTPTFPPPRSVLTHMVMITDGRMPVSDNYFTRRKKTVPTIKAYLKSFAREPWATGCDPYPTVSSRVKLADPGGVWHPSSV